jgi:pyruvate,water dikinase
MLLAIQARLWGRAPEGTTEALSGFIDRYNEKIREQLDAARPGADRLRAGRALLGVIFLEVAEHIMPHVAAGVMAHALLERLLGDPAATADLQAITRGLSGNVTTEMDLALGDLADKARGCDALAARLIAGADVESALEVARADPGGAAFLAAWQEFIARYGMRGPSEIDIARPRFRDDPKALIELISANLQHGEAGAHRARYKRLAEEGEAAAARLVARARTGPLGRARERLASRLVRVARANLPAREHPKFLLMRFFDGLRSAILEAAALLLEEGRLDALSDIWALDLDEVIRALEHPSEDVRSRVRLRHAQMDRFRQMRPPRVITSDGEIPVVRHASAHLPEGALPGTGVSAGVIEGVARVVLDPQKERLRPGEILVAPFTDPGWTPLFIHAAGLVTEVGGMMTHGSVVAREYGIPAVVGVLDATRSIRSGQRIRVDGDSGYVTIVQGVESPSTEQGPA